VTRIEGLQIETVGSFCEARACLTQESSALFLPHLTQPEDVEECAVFMRDMAAARRPIATVVLSERYRAEQALTLLRQGAADFLSRPLDLHRLSYLIDVLTVRARFKAHAAEAAMPAALERLGNSNPILYVRDGMLGEILEKVQRVAPQDTTLLITGGTGTGKTRLARLVHELSPRRAEPFLVVNCGALSATLIESELFGHVRGAFTGADRDRAGKFTDAGRGTLLLDDIDALPPAQQAKLLRVVEERVFEPVGSNKLQPFRARLIVATNQILEEEVTAGRFRQDLYYRLHVVAFSLPPLCERTRVIPGMVEHFIREFAARNDRGVSGISAEALRALVAYSWPGNIRELRNVIERAVALCPGTTIQLDDLPAGVQSSVEQLRTAVPHIASEAVLGTLAQSKEEAEAARISAALARHKNNRLRAAAELGISRMTLYKKLHRYGFITPT
jgi:DNA-binding NtrC family response regulator